MFGKAADAEAPVEKVNQQKLLDEMREDGMKLRWTAWEIKDDPRVRKYENVHPDAASEAGLRPSSSRKDPDNMLQVNIIAGCGAYNQGVVVRPFLGKNK